jgi:translation initiation factor IF-2
MAGKPIRLGKAAGELNVGISTLIDFLHSKGIKIDTNPNTKLEPEHYDILQKEFAADQNLKEQSKFSTVKRERRETISIRDSKSDAPEATEEEEEDVEPINVEEIKRIVSEEPKVEEAPKEPTVEEVIEEKPKPAREGEVQVQVVGKIDLDKLNTKTRPDKKVQEPKVEKAPEPKQEVKPEEKPKIVEEKAPVQTPEPPKEIETIRVERKVLTGPTVLGRIELPVEKPKTSGGKPGDDSNDSRKKRKRIKKIDVNTTPNTGNDAGGGNKNFKKGAPKVDKPQVTERDIQKEIKETLARLSNQGGKSKASKNRRAKRDDRAHRREQEQMAA